MKGSKSNKRRIPEPLSGEMKKMKKFLTVFMIALMVVSTVFANGAAEATTDDSGFTPGKVTIWCTGQPQYREMYYKGYFDRCGATEAGVDISVETIATMADGQQKIAMYSMAGDSESLPEVIMLDAVGIINLSEAGLLVDQTDFFMPQADKYVDGAVNDATVNGKVYGLPDAVRPQLLFYNAAIFEEYNINPAMMETMEGYLEAGRLLKERSNGKVCLSWIDPTSYTWRYWGRRGLMPQAGARIWDENGNVVIGSDEGTKKALGLLDSLYSEGLLYKTNMMQQPIYEATDEGKIATFYIGAFWDEFLRKNLTATAGDWRVMKAPVFEGIGTGGAPVSTYFCVVETGDDTYEDLIHDLWYDFQNNTAEINAWVTEMEKIKGAYSNPVSLSTLSDPFWQEPSEFYGGQSFRKAESDGLSNPSKNLMVTPQDAEADIIISAEIEKYVAGKQTMDEAIANMDKELKLKIGKADI